ncbi:HAD family hydrolase [Jeotgalibacillus haloalkalitolerans]|uniref:HAD-IA family hydrolase n=1 Tax=Jeotgalibacillus haloalkalitolerans TaxID=3104292 RepID=A0ABU5KQP9_9BACL|nr:HAD-IA family hydrolase [Jeotgalibacillus sp. HH7-29]MDZ5713574.1 HAD-IA family hydrolase [Jeotgalibacillus sp. HH7-29]
MTSRTIQVGSTPVSASVVAFDKDGTLFQAEPFWKALNKERKKRFVSMTGLHHGEEWDRIMGVTETGVDHSGLLAVASEAEEKTVIAALLYQHTGKPWIESLALAEKLLEESNESLNIQEAFIPVKGAAELLQELKQSGYVVGIATSDNKERTAACMKLLNFREADFIVTPENVKHGKPAPDMLEKICRDFTVPPEQVLMVGDSIVDCMMAKAAGCKSIAVNENPELRHELAQIADFSLTDVADILIKWES